MVSGRVTRWENLEEARAALGDAVGDGGDVVDGEAAARRAHAMCNPHARARTAGTAGRGIDNPPSSKKKTQARTQLSSTTTGCIDDTP